MQLDFRRSGFAFALLSRKVRDGNSADMTTSSKTPTGKKEIGQKVDGRKRVCQHAQKHQPIRSCPFHDEPFLKKWLLTDTCYVGPNFSRRGAGIETAISRFLHGFRAASPSRFNSVIEADVGRRRPSRRCRSAAGNESSAFGRQGVSSRSLRALSAIPFDIRSAGRLSL